MNKKNIIISLYSAMVLLTSSVNAADNEKIYASVNGTNITSTDISIALKNPQINFDLMPKAQQKQILEQLVQKQLLTNLAVSSNVSSSKTYKETLKSTINNLKKELALRIWLEDLSKKVSINDSEIKDYYNNNKDKFKKQDEYKASHILLKTEDEANKIIEELKKSKSLKDDFAKLAKEKSTGPSASNGGDLGWFSADKMVPEFSSAVSKLKINGFTKNVVKTQFGYHVIYLEDKKDAKTMKLDDVKNQIKMFLSSNKFKLQLDEIIKKETSKAKITYN